jgi:hypothetical protein
VQHKIIVKSLNKCGIINAVGGADDVTVGRK